ncbi:MAG TPA: hypothetical protein VF556_02765 [Pyrinomonadaceae bacterium]|jgi:hypothetical protein
MSVSHLISLLTLLIICGLLFPVYAQSAKSISLKVTETKPSVYISFDHSGKQKALFEGESNNRTWLRLHNNTKLNLFLCVFDVDKKYGNKGLFYDVERIAISQEKEQIPAGYGRIDDCEVFTLLSGKNLLFSLPSEHIGKGLFIKVRFHYGWTGDWKKDIYEGTTHFVTFGNY